MIIRSNVTASSKVEKIKRLVNKNYNKFTDHELNESILEIRKLDKIYNIDISEYISFMDLAFVLKDGMELIVIIKPTGNLYKYRDGNLNKINYCIGEDLIGGIDYDNMHTVKFALLEEISLMDFNINDYRIGK